jgi:hypothetical protein
MLAWLGLAYLGLAWLGPRPLAGPSTALFMDTAKYVLFSLFLGAVLTAFWLFFQHFSLLTISVTSTKDF